MRRDRLKQLYVLVRTKEERSTMNTVEVLLAAGAVAFITRMTCSYTFFSHSRHIPNIEINCTAKSEGCIHNEGKGREEQIIRYLKLLCFMYFFI